MKNKFLLMTIAIMLSAMYSVAQVKGTITDKRDGKVYKTVKIGTQTWMAKNLNYSSGNSWCYEDSSSNCTKYGRLYDWETAKKVCPSGWHLPTDTEWTTLTANLGGEDAAGKKMKSTNGWNDYEGQNGNGINSGAFAGLPGGSRYGIGIFSNIGSIGEWWSSSEYDDLNAWYRGLYNSSDKLGIFNYYKVVGLSVRCIRN